MTTNLIIMPLLPTDPTIAGAMLLDFVNEANSFLADCEFSTIPSDNNEYIKAAISLVGFIAYELAAGNDPISTVYSLVFDEFLYADLDVLSWGMDTELGNLTAPEL